MGVASKIADLVPGLKYDLRELNSELDGNEYVARALVNSMFWGAFFFAFLTLLRMLQGAIPAELVLNAITTPDDFFAFIATAQFALISGLGLGLVFFAVMLFFPRVQSRKMAENVDRDLAFALKDLQLQVSSGVSLFDALVNISKANYGYVSKELGETVRDINAGEASDRALEKLAERSQSEFMRKTLWHLVSAVRSGSSLHAALKSTIFTLVQYQKSQIRKYSGELNIMALMYMIFAVAIPGLGSTLLIVMSAFSSARITTMTYIVIVVIAFVLEVMVIGLIKSRRPSVHF